MKLHSDTVSEKIITNTIKIYEMKTILISAAVVLLTACNTLAGMAVDAGRGGLFQQFVVTLHSSGHFGLHGGLVVELVDHRNVQVGHAGLAVAAVGVSRDVGQHRSIVLLFVLSNLRVFIRFDSCLFALLCLFALDFMLCLPWRGPVPPQTHGWARGYCGGARPPRPRR